MTFVDYSCFTCEVWSSHDHFLFLCADVPLKEKLLDPGNAATAADDEFLREFAMVVGDRWPSLASLLSFPTADVEQMRREVVGTPAEQALHMLRAWRRRSREGTYGGLCTQLKSISLFGTSSK